MPLNSVGSSQFSDNPTLIDNGTEKYITSETLNRCFIESTSVSVDKVLTGNGFSSCFLMERVKEGKINIMIAPNRGVVLGKEEAYNEKDSYLSTSPNRIGFVYKGSQPIDFDNCDIIVIVSDSFLVLADRISKVLKGRISRVLNDESHSAESQSGYRVALENLLNKVQRIVCPNNPKASITSLTASPNHFSKVDIKIINHHIPRRIIYQSNNIVESMDRASDLIKDGEKVIIFTHDTRQAAKILVDSGVLKFDLIAGDSFKRSLSKHIEQPFQIDSKSTIKVITAKGMEGLDIYGEGYNVFFFEDRKEGYTTFTIANLYQAISRPRDQAKYIEYARTENGSDRVVTPKRLSTIEKYARIFEGTKKSDMPKDSLKYLVINSKGSTDGRLKNVEVNEIKWNLDRERCLYDGGLNAPEFSEFLSDRNIEVINLNNKQVGYKKTKKNLDKTEQNIFINREFLRKENLIEDYEIKILGDNKGKARKMFDIYSNIYEYYCIKDAFQDYKLKPRQMYSLRLTSKGGEKDYERLLKDVTRAYNKRSIAKYGKIKSKRWRDEFRIKGDGVLKIMLQGLASDTIQTYSNWQRFRDYNVFTKIGIDEIEIIAEALRFKFVELDISACYLRMAYAECGVGFVYNEIYGAAKEHKEGINRALNMIAFDPTSKTNETDQRINASNRLSNIDSDVREYLLNKFFKRPKNAFFNHYSFLEMSLISDVMIDINKVFGGQYDSLVRRHDSVLIIEPKFDVSFFNTYQFKEVGGWFNVSNSKDAQ